MSEPVKVTPRPIELKAWQFRKDMSTHELKALAQWCDGWYKERFNLPGSADRFELQLHFRTGRYEGGVQVARDGYWVVRDPMGFFSAHSPISFEARYVGVP